MRLGFVVAGVGAACAFGVVSNRIALSGASHYGDYELTSDDRRTPGVDLAARDDGGELIDIGLRLDEVTGEPGKLNNFGNLKPGGGPPPTVFVPFQTDQSFGGPQFGDGGIGGMSGAGANIAAGLNQPPGPTEPPPPNAPPSGGGPGGGGPGGVGGFTSPPTGPDQPPPGQPPPEPPTGGPPPPPPNFPPPGPPVPPPGGNPPPVITQQTPPPGGGGGGGPTGAVPEPATWTAMLLGFAAIGHVLRRRRYVTLARPAGRRTRA